MKDGRLLLNGRQLNCSLPCSCAENELQLFVSNTEMREFLLYSAGHIGLQADVSA